MAPIVPPGPSLFLHTQSLFTGRYRKFTVVFGKKRLGRAGGGAQHLLATGSPRRVGVSQSE